MEIVIIRNQYEGVVQVLRPSKFYKNYMEDHSMYNNCSVETYSVKTKEMRDVLQYFLEKNDFDEVEMKYNSKSKNLSIFGTF